MSVHPKLSSVQLKCGSDSRTETSPPKVRHIFCLKTQIDKKTVKHFIGNPIFHIMIVCAGKVHFWQLRWKLLAISMAILFSKLEVCEKRKKLRKKIIRFVLWRAKNAILSPVQKKSSKVTFFSDLNHKMMRKRYCSQKFVLFSRWFSSSDGRAELFQQMSGTFFPSGTKNDLKTLTFFQRKSQFSSNVRLYTYFTDLTTAPEILRQK